MKTYKLLLALVAVVLLSYNAVAEDAPQTENNLQASADRINCNLDFYASVMASVSNRTDQDLTSWGLTLRNTTEQLKLAAGEGSIKQFHNYTSQVRSQLKLAETALRSARKNYSSSITNETREAIKDDYHAAKVAFSECEKHNDLNVAQTRVAQYTKALSNAQQQAEKLGERNISIVAITQLIADAQTAIVDQLKAAADSGEVNKSSEALSQYCLYDGCKNGTNFHFDAKFEIARLNALLSEIKSLPNSSEFASDILQIQSNLDFSSAALAKIGTTAYLSTSEKNVWDPLKLAANGMKQLRGDYAHAAKARWDARKEQLKTQLQQKKEQLKDIKDNLSQIRNQTRDKIEELRGNITSNRQGAGQQGMIKPPVLNNAPTEGR